MALVDLDELLVLNVYIQPATISKTVSTQGWYFTAWPVCVTVCDCVCMCVYVCVILCIVLYDKQSLRPTMSNGYLVDTRMT